MKFSLYTVSCSPHQLPLAKEIMAITGEGEYRYISAKPVREERKKIGWGDDVDEKWHIKEWEKRKEAREVLENCKVLMSGERDLELMEDRCTRHLTTIYCSERWFKPILGFGRLLMPSYFWMALRIIKLLSLNSKFYYFPMGIHAARDMARVCGLVHGDLRCLFRAPELEFEKRPGGKIWLKGEKIDSPNSRKYCLDKMRMWGYFVETSNLELQTSN